MANVKQATKNTAKTKPTKQVSKTQHIADVVRKLPVKRVWPD
jgi:hypothetical protein